MSEFLKEHPRISSREDLPRRLEDSWLFGYANTKRKEMWVFVDELANYYGLYHRRYPAIIGKIMRDIVSTTVHELIHLNGVEDEDITEYGEDMVMRKWLLRDLKKK